MKSTFLAFCLVRIDGSHVVPKTCPKKNKNLQKNSGYTSAGWFLELEPWLLLLWHHDYLVSITGKQQTQIMKSWNDIWYMMLHWIYPPGCWLVTTRMTWNLFTKGSQPFNLHLPRASILDPGCEVDPNNSWLTHKRSTVEEAILLDQLQDNHASSVGDKIASSQKHAETSQPPRSPCPSYDSPAKIFFVDTIQSTVKRTVVHEHLNLP